MRPISTGSPSVQVSFPTTNDAAPMSDPVAAAKLQREDAEKNEADVTDAQGRADQLQSAKDATAQAKDRSKKAFDADANSSSGRQAHQTASLAHGDAAKQYGKIAGSDEHDLETRAKAQNKADYHSDMAEKHDTICQGGALLGKGMRVNTRRNSMSRIATGSRGIVANIQSPTTNVWSDAARQASAEARRGDRAADKSFDAFHMSQMADKESQKAFAGRIDHSAAAGAHADAALENEGAADAATDPAAKKHFMDKVKYHHAQEKMHDTQQRLIGRSHPTKNA